MTVTAPAATDAAFRAAIVTALDAGPWYVHPNPVDAIEPPCYMVTPSTRTDWYTRTTVGAYRATLDVAAIVGRTENFGALAEAVDTALGRLQAARLALGIVLPAAPLDIAGVPYLAARIPVSTIVTIPED